TIPSIPFLFRASNLLPEPPIPLPDPAEDSAYHGKEVPINEWIFGQFNKLLPLKVNTRALANMLVETKRILDPESVGRSIAQSAGVLGDYLRALDQGLDQAEGVARDRAFATAFPESDSNSAKSQLRYKNQFVVSISKQYRVSGLLHEYKFLA